MMTESCRVAGAEQVASVKPEISGAKRDREIKRARVANWSPERRLREFATPKLTEAQVGEILYRRHVLGECGNALAIDYGVHEATVSRICNGRTWLHVWDRFQAKRWEGR